MSDQYLGVVGKLDRFNSLKKQILETIKEKFEGINATNFGNTFSDIVVDPVGNSFIKWRGFDVQVPLTDVKEGCRRDSIEFDGMSPPISLYNLIRKLECRFSLVITKNIFVRCIVKEAWQKTITTCRWEDRQNLN